MSNTYKSDELFRSLTGFEEVMIRQLYGRAATLLAKDASEGDTFPLMRALITVVEKRDGATPGDAFSTVMHMTAEDVAGKFDDEPADDLGEAPAPR